MSSTIKDVDVSLCDLSRFNTRKTRPEADLDRLADRIKRNGFERTRAPWAVEVDGRYHVFAGGTRMLAARRAGLTTIPVLVYSGLDDDTVSRLADEDNENDEYHASVPFVDVWAEFHRLKHEELWTQDRIASAKGCGQPLVAERIQWHERIGEAARFALSAGLFTEGHIQAISSVYLPAEHFVRWLTPEQVQEELVEEVLGKHRGSSVGIKPTRNVVREAAARWKETIVEAERAWEEFGDDEWRDRFVDELARSKARGRAAVVAAATKVQAARSRAADEAADAARAALSRAEQEAKEARERAARDERIASHVRRIALGDARVWVGSVQQKARLLLTDPPYGLEFRSNRRTASAKKGKIANDDGESAVDVLRDVLTKANEALLDDAHVLVFTSWQHEPAFRDAIQESGYLIKGSLVWVKNNHGTGDLSGAFAPKHERIIHAVKGSPRVEPRIPDVLSGHDKQNSAHPTEKPVDLLSTLIKSTTKDGDLVLDPFAGKGSTLLAALANGREALGCEIDPQHHQDASNAVLSWAEAE